MLLPSPRHLRYAPRVLFYIAVIYGLTWIAGYPREYDDEELGIDNPTKRPLSQELPVDKVIISVRAPGTVAYHYFPTLLFLTKSVHYDNMLLYSDIEMDIGGFHVEDLLSKFEEDFVARNTDFERYRNQIQYAQYGLNLHRLKDPDPERERQINLALDRYKYLQMLERTWSNRPERMWYVFMEADTYLVRSNLMEFLGEFNPEENFFFGNHPHANAPNPFGHSGSTFILSVGAMRRLFPKKNKDMLIKNWTHRIQEFKLGYDVLTAALENEIRLTLNTTFPHISGFTPATAPFGPGTWCEPIIALQGMRPEDQSDMWRYERDRAEFQHIKQPLAFEDLYMAFVKPQDLFMAQSDWDNLSSDETNSDQNILLGDDARARHWTKHMHEHQHGHPHAAREEPEQVVASDDAAAHAADESFEACRDACNQNDQCLQYSYSSIPVLNFNENGGTRCHLSRKMRFGVHKFPEEVRTQNGDVLRRTWKSGWRKDRLEAWAGQQRCKGPKSR